jgi:plasmid stabilization system protein ParE
MSSYKIKITEQADIDIVNLHSFIAETCKSPLTAKCYVNGLFAAIKVLSYSAGSYSISTQKSILRFGYNARKINYKKMAIVYTIHGDSVLIQRVIPGSLISRL